MTSAVRTAIHIVFIGTNSEEIHDLSIALKKHLSVLKDTPESVLHSSIQTISHSNQLSKTISSLTQSALLFLFADTEQSTASPKSELAIARSILISSGLEFQVINTPGKEQRLTQVIHALGSKRHLSALTRPELPIKWIGSCEICSDGDCEHRLFLFIKNSK
jgi:hypothetical protein